MGFYGLSIRRKFRLFIHIEASYNHNDMIPLKSVLILEACAPSRSWRGGRDMVGDLAVSLSDPDTRATCGEVSVWSLVGEGTNIAPVRIA